MIMDESDEECDMTDWLAKIEPAMTGRTLP